MQVCQESVQTAAEIKWHACSLEAEWGKKKSAVVCRYSCGWSDGSGVNRLWLRWSLSFKMSLMLGWWARWSLGPVSSQDAFCCSSVRVQQNLTLELFLWPAMISMAISAYCKWKAPFNVDSLTSPQLQPTPSTPCCPLLPVSLSGPWQTLWSGLLGAAHMCVCSLSHLVAWHAAQCASSISVYPAWRREIKQKKKKLP